MKSHCCQPCHPARKRTKRQGKVTQVTLSKHRSKTSSSLVLKLCSLGKWWKSDERINSKSTQLGGHCTISMLWRTSSKGLEFFYLAIGCKAPISRVLKLRWLPWLEPNSVKLAALAITSGAVATMLCHPVNKCSQKSVDCLWVPKTLGVKNWRSSEKTCWNKYPCHNLSKACLAGCCQEYILQSSLACHRATFL